MTDVSDVSIVIELAQPDMFAFVGIKQDLEELLKRLERCEVYGVAHALTCVASV